MVNWKRSASMATPITVPAWTNRLAPTIDSFVPNFRIHTQNFQTAIRNFRMAVFCFRMPPATTTTLLAAVSTVLII